MKLQPRRTKIINVIIISHLEFSSLPPYLPMQLIDEPGETAETFLQHRFPDAEQFIFLPPTFSAVITALSQNEITCSVCSKLILQHLGLCYSREGDPIGREDFTSEQAVMYYCINVVVNHYITIALDSHNFGEEERSQLHLQVIEATIRWNTWRLNRLEGEQYLGRNIFAHELSRSCGEFYAELKQSLGFRPITWLFFK